MLLAITLMTALWMGFTALQPDAPATPEAGADAGTVATPAPPDAPVAVDPAVDPATVAAADAAPEVVRAFETNVAETSKTTSVAVKGGYRAELTSRGAQIQRFTLTGYNDTAQKLKEGEAVPHVELANGVYEGARLFALHSSGGDVLLPADAPYVEVPSTEPGTTTFERQTASGVTVQRSFHFEDGRFAFQQKLTLKNTSATAKKAIFNLTLTGQERSGERDEGGMFQPPVDQLAGACHVAGEREHFTSRDVEEEQQRFDGAVTAIALDRHYFLAALVPPPGSTSGCQATFWRSKADGSVAVADADAAARGVQLTVALTAIDLAPGEVKTLTFEGFAGPKQLDLLQQFGHELEDNIDFGIFGILSRPMLWVLVKLHATLGNFGVAIILLTFLMKLLTFPLTQKSYVSMQAMRTLQPELKELQKKYGHDRTVMGQKQMELYQQRGINPMAGCLPVLVQMPIWFALYRTLSQAVELYQQPFVGYITDLTQPDVLFNLPVIGPLAFLPFIVGGLMLWQTALQPPPEDQPQMKYVMWGMPIMFTFLMLSMASGLSIYMITNSVLSMAQQYYIKRKYGTPPPASSTSSTPAARKP